MRYRTIGKLQVSVVGLGCNQFGTSFCDEAATASIVGEAIDAGITYFDTADEYGANYRDPNDPEGWGRSEEYLGRALGSKRDGVVIGSKFGVKPHGAEGGGASAQWARSALDASLRRLGADHIDLYQLHFPDPSVPIEETLGVMGEMVEAGKVREIGCCNFSGAQLDAAQAAAGDTGHAFASAQNPLNLLQRGALEDSMPACERHRIAFIPYYPLASGVLTGKYRPGQTPQASRLSEQVTPELRERLLSAKTFARLDALEAFAAARSHTLLELAFAWLLGHPRVSTVIAGAARQGQAASNAAAGAWELSPDEVAEVTRLVQSAA